MERTAKLIELASRAQQSLYVSRLHSSLQNPICYRWRGEARMSGTDKEAILIRVSEFLSKSVNDLADALNTVAKQVTEFQASLKKIRSDLKSAEVTPMAASSTPLLAAETTTAGPSSDSLFDYLEGDTAAMVTADTGDVAESILLGEPGPPAAAAPPAAPTTAPPKAPPTGPPSAPPKGPPTAPAKAPPSAPPSAAPSAPPSAPPTAAPVPPPSGPPPAAATAAAAPASGIAGLRTEMMAEIKRIKEIFET